jgi:hypothetical protein
MKRILMLAILLTGTIAFRKADAQVRVNVNVNIGSQPVWGPVGYDYAEYYYMPDIEAYYYVPSRQFIYLDGPRWVWARSLPPRYRGYDIYHGYKVVINEPRPYLHHNDYKVRYAGYRNRHDQVIIRDSRDAKYYPVKGHPGHGNWKAERSRGRGHRS